jgi:hypothetical protein
MGRQRSMAQDGTHTKAQLGRSRLFGGIYDEGHHDNMSDHHTQGSRKDGRLGGAAIASHHLHKFSSLSLLSKEYPDLHTSPLRFFALHIFIYLVGGPV